MSDRKNETCTHICILKKILYRPHKKFPFLYKSALSKIYIVMKKKMKDNYFLEVQLHIYNLHSEKKMITTTIKPWTHTISSIFCDL